MKKLFLFLFLFSAFYMSSHAQCPEVTIDNSFCQMTITVSGAGEFWYKVGDDIGNPGVYDEFILGSAGTYTLIEFYPDLCFWEDQYIHIGYWDETQEPDEMNGGAQVSWCSTLYDGPDCGVNHEIVMEIEPTSQNCVFNVLTDVTTTGGDPECHTVSGETYYFNAFGDVGTYITVEDQFGNEYESNHTWIDINTFELDIILNYEGQTIYGVYYVTLSVSDWEFWEDFEADFESSYCYCDDYPAQILATPVAGCNNYSLTFIGSDCQEENFYFSVDEWDPIDYYSFNDIAIEHLYDNVYHIDPYESPCTFGCYGFEEEGLFTLYAMIGVGYVYAEVQIPISPCPCGDPTACNYSGISSETTYSCVYDVMGCTNLEACNYDSLAACDDGSCVVGTSGCMDETACNFDSTAVCDDGSCEGELGCMDSGACNYDADFACDDGSCTYECVGCADTSACNFDSTFTILDDSCFYPGCIDSAACNYDSTAGCDDLSCNYSWCYGCTDSTACNYLDFFIFDDGSCTGTTGCLNASACNYDPLAECDNGTSCEGESGCMETDATNYNPLATCDDGSCSFFADANGDGEVNILDLAFIINDFGCTSDCEADINGDGFTNILDIVMFSSYF